MSTLNRISTGQQDLAIGDVVLVHGLGGDPYKTWQYYDRPEGFWPLWLAQDIPQLNVWTVGYEAAPSAWLGTAMPLTDRARNVLDLLTLDRIGTRPLAFICHSLGGLVVKQMLRAANDSRSPEFLQLRQNVKGIVFLATPHTGSLLAKYLSALSLFFRVNVTIRDLEAFSAPLRDLNTWFREKSQSGEFKNLVLFETQGVKVPRLLRFRNIKVVDEVSADPGIAGLTPIPIDADHLSICKPRSRIDPIYQRVRQFIGSVFQPAPGEPPRRSASAIELDSLGSLFDKNERRPYRFFISYRRSSSPDSALAQHLASALKTAGADVFIDVSMTVGTNWSAEIATRISWCDWFLLLVSTESNGAEAVLEEVVAASRRQKAYGRPGILPVFINFTDILEYELSTYIGHLQHIIWTSEADNTQVFDEIVNAVAVGLKAEPRGRVPEPQRVVTTERFEATEIGRPTGAVRLEDPHYVIRPADQLLSSASATNGTTVVIKGPRQTGKSSLLIRYLARCTQLGKQVLFADFQSFGKSDLDDYEAFLQRFADHCIYNLNRSLETTPVRTALEMANFFESRIFPATRRPLVIAIDRADRLLGAVWQDDFFGMLRDWHNRRWMSGWADLDLALVIATEPYILVSSEFQSPFNVGEIVELGPFTEAEVARLNESYGRRLLMEDCDSMFSLLRGHPYLSRIALYYLVNHPSLSWRDFERSSLDESGPFADHLKSLLLLLNRAGLEDAMREVIGRGRTPMNDMLTFYRLRGAGLVLATGSRIVPANPLYARFFRRVLR